jgi:outer membrane protein OmpA-like peptidoglycan-associated protein
LILQGIDKNRLSFMGYGELEPIASNDTPHGRTLNRRTEFKILQINN